MIFIDFTLPPSMNAARIAKMRGSDQLRACAQIIDALGGTRIHEDFVLGYASITSSIIDSVSSRLKTAVNKEIKYEVLPCQSAMTKTTDEN